MIGVPASSAAERLLGRGVEVGGERLACRGPPSPAAGSPSRPSAGRPGSARSGSWRCRWPGLTSPSTWVTSSSRKTRVTWQIAADSRMWERNLLPRPSPSEAPRDDAGDVDELDGRGQDLGRAEDLRELRQPLVGDADDADVRLDRGERVVRREHVVLGQGVEEGRLARVGESDDADGECHGPASLRRLRRRSPNQRGSRPAATSGVRRAATAGAPSGRPSPGRRPRTPSRRPCCPRSRRTPPSRPASARRRPGA